MEEKRLWDEALKPPKLWNAADHSQAIMFYLYLLCIIIICSLTPCRKMWAHPTLDFELRKENYILDFSHYMVIARKQAFEFIYIIVLVSWESKSCTTVGHWYLFTVCFCTFLFLNDIRSVRVLGSCLDISGWWTQDVKRQEKTFLTPFFFNRAAKLCIQMW